MNYKNCFYNLARIIYKKVVEKTIPWWYNKINLLNTDKKIITN